VIDGFVKNIIQVGPKTYVTRINDEHQCCNIAHDGRYINKIWTKESLHMTYFILLKDEAQLGLLYEPLKN